MASDSGSESEKEDVLYEHTVLDELHPYKFRYTLTKHYEFNSAAFVQGAILCGDATVGSLNGLLIDRRVESGWNFFAVCDSESAELDHIGQSLCTRDGSVRAADVEGFDAERDEEANTGGFLHVELVKLDRAHRGKDVGIRCVHALLQWMNALDSDIDSALREMLMFEDPDLEWTLAAMQPALLTAESRGMSQAEVDVNIDKVIRQFARLGFRQASFGSEVWYLTPRNLELRTKTAVQDLQITRMPTVQRCDADKPLDAFFNSINSYEGMSLFDFAQGVNDAVAQGAQPVRAHALHLLAASGQARKDYYTYLCDTFKISIDDRDEFGCSSLHAAVCFALVCGPDGSIVRDILRFHIDRRIVSERSDSGIASVRALLELGASPLVRNCRGDTPVETVDRVMLARHNFLSTFGHDSTHGEIVNEEALAIRQLLLSAQE